MTLKNTYSRDWEDLGNGVERLCVPSGWIVAGLEGVCFVPDERHEWKLAPTEET